MLFEEYKKIFEEILELTEELELICKNKKDGDFDKVFEKRDKLFQKLETPEDVTEERIEEIRLIRDKIQEKNKFILRTIQVSRNEIKKALLEMIVNTDADTGYLHEGFHVDNPREFTREWFTWPNSLFCEFVEMCVDENII